MTLTDKPPTVDSKPVSTGRRPPIAQIVTGGVLVLIGMLWLLQRTGVVDLNVTTVFALATMVTGIALMLLARQGPHVGLIVLGTILGLLALVTAAAPFEGFQGGVGDRVVVIDTVDDIGPDYNQSMGNLTLDLRQVDDLDTTTRLNASVGLGELVVRVREGTEIAVDAKVGAGQIEILDRMIDGVGIDEQYESPRFDESSERLTLDLDVFTGRVEVTDE
jgi:hypothetical protein